MTTDASAFKSVGCSLQRICDVTCITFALWTVCAHVVVVVGGSLIELVALFALAGFALITAFTWEAKNRTPRPDDGHFANSRMPFVCKHPYVSILLGLAAVTSVSAYVAKGQEVTWWLGSILILIVGVIYFRVDDPKCPQAQKQSTTSSISPLAILGLMALALVMISLVAHRPDADDAFYVNIAVNASSHPTSALLRHDSLHGIPGLPLHNPAHQVHTFELANAAVAWLTGLAPLTCFHILTVVIVGALAVFIYGRFFQLLSPNWLMLTAIVLAVLLASGELHRGYGNFAFVRLWQGKSILITVGVPLIYVTAFQYGAKPSLYTWCILTAAQVAAVGLSSSGIWLAPLSATLVLISQPQTLRRLAIGMLASTYPLVIGLVLLFQSDIGSVAAGAVKDAPAGTQLARSLAAVFGSHPLGFLYLIGVSTAYLVATTRRARRFALVIPLITLLLLGNPFLEALVRRFITGPAHWRGFWALPGPILVALLLHAPFATARRIDHLRGRWAAALCGIAAIGVPFVISTRSVLSPKSIGGAPGTTLATPGWKVPHEEFSAAKATNEAGGSAHFVVAPERVSRWIPTMRDYAYPLVTRSLYLDAFQRRGLVSREEVSARKTLVAIVSGHTRRWPKDRKEEIPRLLANGIDAYDITAICIPRAQATRNLRPLLQTLHFTSVRRTKHYEVWKRSD